MPTVREGNVIYTFPSHWEVTKYDAWTFYRNRFASSCCSNKAVDFLAFNPRDQNLWLIELKDYRIYPRTKDDKLSLWEEIALKVRDTLAGLFAAKVDVNHGEQSFAALALSASKLRVVLHLEQPRTHSKLFPRAYDPADIQQKLKQTLRPIDTHPKVIELKNMQTVPWNAV